MHRFFVPPKWIANQQAVLGGKVAHQVSRVLRMRPGQRLVLLDDSGWEFETELRIVEPDRIQGQILDKRLAQREPHTQITLYQGVLKGDRFEFALQKATELGVIEFVPLITARTVVGRLADVQKKRQRWQQIIREAAEQSGRGRLPRLQEPMLLAGACARAQHNGGLSLLPWEETPAGSRLSLKQALRQAAPSTVNLFVAPEEGLTAEESNLAHRYGLRLVNLFIGPEGGFTRQEVDLAQQHDIPAITLGSRVLRAETAAIVAVAIVLHEMGDLE